MQVSKTHNPLPIAADVEEQVRAWVMLARTFGRHHRYMSAMLMANGVTGPQFDILATVYSHEGRTQQEVADNLLVTKGNVTLVIENLERDGLIERRQDPSDGRVKRVFLTGAGRARLGSIRPSHRAAIIKVWQSFSGQELATLTGILARVESRLIALDDKNE